MSDLGGSWLKLGLALRSAAAANGSLIEGQLEVSRQTQLVLEILMVLMCLGAVTGTANISIYLLFLFPTACAAQ